MTGDQIGQQLGVYQVQGVLGRGALGQVLRAADTQDGHPVALTLLDPPWTSDGAYRRRFLESARIALRLSEPHAVPVERYGEVAGRLFLAARLVDGHDLATLLATSGPLGVPRAVGLIGQVARALDAAHAVGLVHGHLSAADVLLTGDDGADVVRLTGLGLAPPAELDPSEDIAALAGVLFELLTGRPPVPAIVPQAPSSLRSDIPPDLDGVVLRGLAADYTQRWTSAGGLAAAARAVLSVSGMEVTRPADRPPTDAAAASSPGTARRLLRRLAPRPR